MVSGGVRLNCEGNQRIDISHGARSASEMNMNSISLDYISDGLAVAVDC
jgi:hypothetical protein